MSIKPPVRWGILGVANIAVTKVIPSMKNSSNGEVTAISSRSLDRAQEAANKLGIEKAYGRYEDLLEDPDIDAIYNPLPNDMHVPWTLKALAAGKHVLCEKPLGLNAADVMQLESAARDFAQLKFMEAFMYGFHPQWEFVRKTLASEGIGKVKAVRAMFTYNRNVAEDYRNRASAGGGGLLDVGCYGISASRMAFGSEPTKACGVLEMDSNHDVDKGFHGLLAFPCGGTASIYASTKVEFAQSVFISGDRGSITVNIPFIENVDGDVFVDVVRDGKLERNTFVGHTHYKFMVEQFCDAIIKDTEVPIAFSNSLNNMRVLDAFFASDKQNAWVNI